MKAPWTVLVTLCTLFMLAGCPTKPTKDPYGDPDAARDRADKAHKELDRDTR